MPTILIVDDEEIDREAAQRCLRDLKLATIRMVESGQEALEFLNRRAPDVVVTDLRMPGMDGLALVEKIREDHPLLPVVLMTSKGSERIAVKALKAGASSYVPKRHLKRYLPHTIRQLLEVARAARKQGQILKFLQRVETEFEVQNDLSLIVPLVGFFQDNLKRIGFANESIRNQVGIALMEAISNAIVHGNLELESDLRRSDPESYRRLLRERSRQQPYSSRRVLCRAKESRRRIEYTICDEGPGFDVASLPKRQAAGLLDVAGRGVMLIRSFMDTVRYNEKGNELFLAKLDPTGKPETKLGAP